MKLTFLKGRPLYGSIDPHWLGLATLHRELFYQGSVEETRTCDYVQQFVSFMAPDTFRGCVLPAGHEGDHVVIEPKENKKLAVMREGQNPKHPWWMINKQRR